jgi:hypothetical protein
MEFDAIDLPVLVSSAIMKAYLEMRVINIGKAEDSDIDERFLVFFASPDQVHDAIDGCASLGDKVGKDCDVNLGRLQDVVVIDKFGKPSLNLYH